jgi:geranylgeranyl diphosphate synthase type I
MDDVMAFLEEKKPVIDSVIRKYFPETLNKQHMTWLFGESPYEYDEHALNKALAEPIWDFLNRGGKRWRPALFLLITEALGGDVEKAKDFAILPELAHEGSLIVDDIEDMAELRRGQPCTHKLFGTDIAINAGNFMFYLPTLVFLKNKEHVDAETLLRAQEVYFQEMINIHAGQATDIYWHKGGAESITEVQYLQMCVNKTGCLSRMAGRLAAILSGRSREQEQKIGKMCETIGVAFQIQDDVLSVSSTEFAAKKGYGDDITEGKRSLMVIHTLNNAVPADKKRLLEILSLHTRDTQLIDEAIELLTKYNSIAYAKERARELVTQAWEAAAPLLPESPAKEKLKAFATFLIERNI